MDLEHRALGFPLRAGPDRGVEVADLVAGVRAMLEQILFTMPGERVNRPTFGVGVQQYVFEPLTPMLSERIRVALDENVYEHLGREVRIDGVSVEREEEKLLVRVTFEIAGSVSGPQDVEIAVPGGGAP
jgi:uncharacterized protein